MGERLKISQEKKWPLLHAAMVYLLFVFILVRPVNFYLLDQVYTSYYMIALPVIVGLYFYNRGLRDGWEIRLVAAYSVWIFISRIINGQLFLQLDRDLVFESFLVCVLLALGVGLNKKERLVFMDVFSFTLCGFMTVLTAIAMYSILILENVLNPITGANLVEFNEFANRLELLGYNSCNSGNWLFVSFCLLIYLFFRYKKLCYRLPIAVSMLLHYICLAVTFTRSVTLSTTIVVALLAAMLFLERREIKKWSKKLIAVVLIICVVAPVCYKGFDLAAQAMGALGSAVRSEQTVDSAEASVTTDDSTAAVPNVYDRNVSITTDTGRLVIYESAFMALQNEPERLIKGSLTRDIISITGAHPQINKVYGHFHNSYIQILVVGGLLGFLLAMGFFVMLVVDVIRIFFAPSGSMDFAMKFLCLPVTGVLFYNLVESSLFAAMDLRAVVFFIIAGFVIASARDLRTADQ